MQTRESGYRIEKELKSVGLQEQYFMNRARIGRIDGKGQYGIVITVIALNREKNCQEISER